MANICDNTLFVNSECIENLDTVIKFFDKKVKYYNCDNNDDCLEIFFDSEWVFPEELMNELFDTIPNKSDIYMRCLSVEYGCMYHALWYCDESGWHEV